MKELKKYSKKHVLFLCAICFVVGLIPFLVQQMILRHYQAEVRKISGVTGYDYDECVKIGNLYWLMFSSQGDKHSAMMFLRNKSSHPIISIETDAKLTTISVVDSLYRIVSVTDQKADGIFDSFDLKYSKNGNPVTVLDKDMDGTYDARVTFPDDIEIFFNGKWKKAKKIDGELYARIDGDLVRLGFRNGKWEIDNFF